MEASTSKSGEIKLIIVKVVRKQQQSSISNNIHRLEFALHEVIPPRVRSGDVKP